MYWYTFVYTYILATSINDVYLYPFLLPTKFLLDLVEEILLTLSVKSLVRFHCVDKSWDSLISDLYFAKKLLRMPTTLTHHHHMLYDAQHSMSADLLSVLNSVDGVIMMTPLKYHLFCTMTLFLGLVFRALAEECSSSLWLMMRTMLIFYGTRLLSNTWYYPLC